jgi:hypothetical protein
MKTSIETPNETRSFRVHIVDVVQQKEGGCTLVVQPHSEDPEMTSEEMWRVALPGDYRGATRVDRLWHLYYGEDPGYSPGACLDVTLPEKPGEA